MSMKKIKSGIVCLLLFIVSIPSPARSQAKWKGTVVKEGDLTVFRNPKEPLYKVPILELKEELSLGGPDVQGDYAFVKIRDIVVDDSGSIYVLDQQDSHVKVFETSGTKQSRISCDSGFPQRVVLPFDPCAVPFLSPLLVSWCLGG